MSEGVMVDQYLDLDELSKYAGLSRRTLRRHLSAEIDDALPCYRVGGKILVKRSEFDDWISRFRSGGSEAVTRVLEELGLTRRQQSG